MSKLSKRLMRLRGFCLLTFAFTAMTGSAVVIKGGTGLGNTNAPADDPGWNNVGSADGYATAVYLGNSWVLTANHVGMRNVILGGNTFAYAADSSFRLTNSDGSASELLMYRLTTLPSLPTLKVSSVAPSTGASVTMIGRGNTRNSSSTRWYVDVNTNPYTWSNTTFTGWDTFIDGFYATNGNRLMRWGTNGVTGTGSALNTPSLYTTFDSSGGNSEAQGTYGDSGGGVFFKNGSVWELSGIILAVATYSGQPDSTVTYGDATYFADLSSFRTEIMAIEAIPEPSALALLMAASLIGCLARRCRGC